MTYLLLQTFLLLLSSYFLGAFTACLMKRAARREPAALAAEVQPAPRPVARAAVPVVAAVPALAPQISPRSYEPLQPKIDILARPEPKAAPPQTDTSRFDRALAHAVLKDDTPRKSIVEIRPAVLKPVTLRPGPGSTMPKPASSQSAKPVTPPQPGAVKPVPAPVPAPQPGSTTATTSAALAAVAAAKAAAAATAPATTTASGVPVVTPPPKPATPPAATQSAVPVTAAPVKPAEPQKPAPAPAAAPPAPTPTPTASVPAPVAKPAAFDDFLRIRAIDEAMSQRLRTLGVRNFDDIAHWTSADINRINQALGLSGRIEREQWIEQAQILAKGGETYYSRSRAAGQMPASSAQPTPPAQTPTPTPAPAATSSAPSGGASSATATAAAAAAAAASASTSAVAAAKAMQQTATQHQAAAAAQPAPPKSAPRSAAPTHATPPPAAAAPAAATPPAPAASSSQPPQRSVSEMATAAAVAIAAASASVTRGVRPIEPISPLSKADPNVSRPARLSDAIKERETKPGDESDLENLRSVKSEAYRSPTSSDEVNDLKRIRGIGVLIEKRLNALGISSYEQIANWTVGDIDRISQTLDFKGRIERENWVEQARILSSGGQTEFSRRVDKGDVESSRDS